MVLFGTPASDYGLGMPITVLLDEGAITVSEGLSETGRTQKNYAMAAPVKMGDIVELFQSTDITFEAAGGLPVMRKPANDGSGSGIFGRVVFIGVPKRVPADSDEAAALGDRLEGGFLRPATVEVMGLKGANVYEIKQDSLATLEIGAAGQLALEFDGEGNPTGYLKVVASGGALPLRSFHYIASGSSVKMALLGVF